MIYEDFKKSMDVGFPGGGVMTVDSENKTVHLYGKGEGAADH